ncbi:transposase [Streptomyces hawaiiensis]|uniref:transposase n=1 Tax=Streptomyces hawaiiensis TaxID=67305 RepID=UPI003666C3C8
MSLARPSSYPPELRIRAVRMVAEVRGDYPNESAALRAVAQKLGIGSAETLRNWVKREEIDSGQRPGTTTATPQTDQPRSEHPLLITNIAPGQPPVRRPAYGDGSAGGAVRAALVAGTSRRSPRPGRSVSTRGLSCDGPGRPRQAPSREGRMRRGPGAVCARPPGRCRR